MTLISLQQVVVPLRVAAIVLCALAFALALSAAPALASRPHEFTGAFGEACLAEPCEGASLKKPNGVAVNEASGEVYVVDEGANRVVRFSGEGVFLSEFNGSGELLNGKGEHFEGKAAGSGGEPGEIATGKFDKPQTIAVDNSCVLRKLGKAECEAEDPSSSDVYVVDAGHRVIDKYSPEGQYIGQITEGGGVKFQEEGLEGVAVGVTGNVYAYDEGFRSIKFSNAIHNAFVSQIRPNGFTDFPFPGFAVDTKGDSYMPHGKHETGHASHRIAKVDSSGTVITKEVDKEDSSGVSVDQGNDNALIDNLTSIAVLDSKGTPIERLGQEGGEEHLKEGAGIGVNAGESTIYVADSATSEVVVFGPKHPTPPKVESESVAEVTSSDALLGAQINPLSEPNEAPTEYSFQYGRCPALDPGSCPSAGYEEVPGLARQIPPDFEVHPVGAKVEGLEPNTTYHFRAVARNSHGEGEAGEERTFTTQSAGGKLILPDNRGWELVSPSDKQGANIEPISEAGVVQAAASGQGITYLANAPTESQPQGYSNLVQILSRRASASWSSRDIAIPHSSATGFAVGPGPEYKFFDPELRLSAVQPFGEFNPALSEGASESTAYLHNLGPSCGSACFHPLVTGKPGFANVLEGTQFGEEELCKPKVTGTGGTHVFCGPEFFGATEDLSHVVLRSNVALEEGSGAGLYEWSGRALAPVSVLPASETEPLGTLGLTSQGAARRAISSDGARIAWASLISLYLRDMAREETVQLDAPQEVGGKPCKGCESGGGGFEIASADGSRVLFTDEKRLTEDSGANPGEEHADLYECKIVLNPKLSCELSDLTPKRGEEGADVRGSVLGASEDAEAVYFVANGVQSGTNGEGKSPASGEPNLYLRKGASTEFIATLSGGDETDWDELAGGPESLSGQPTRVSPNGRYLEFMSQAQPTGYDNRDIATSKPTAEVYLYDASSDKLRCASCDPTGARPVGVEYFKLEPGSGGLVGGPRGIWPISALVAANVPGWTAFDSSGNSRYQPRYLNNQGRLFFNTANALASQDSNNTQDVYQYEPPHTGGCDEESETFSARSGGCVSLISSGESTQESAFLDASESGDDVFFLTQARLSSIDTDNALDVYDAHVCTSGSPCITFPNVQSPPCTTEASCKASPTPQPSIFGSPASATFSGPGNLVSASSTGSRSPVKAKTLSRSQKLAKALRACRRDRVKKRRRVCEAAARKRYGAKGSSVSIKRRK